MARAGLRRARRRRADARGARLRARAEPYEARVVLPHERTHAGPKEGRLRLLRALAHHVEPIFLLYDGPAERPDGEPVWTSSSTASAAGSGA